MNEGLTLGQILTLAIMGAAVIVSGALLLWTLWRENQPDETDKRRRK